MDYTFVTRSDARLILAEIVEIGRGDAVAGQSLDRVAHVLSAWLGEKAIDQYFSLILTRREEGLLRAFSSCLDGLTFYKG